MNIFISNDDGYRSDRIKMLRKILDDYGITYLSAPKSEHSGASCSLSLPPQNKISILDSRTIFVDGTPADSAIYGLNYFKDVKFDLFVSGINYGYNVSSDIQYSATAGAAFEGEFQGILSIAFSEGMNGCHEVTDKYLKEIMAELIDKPYITGQICNVNFPQCKADECKGILRDRKVSRKSFYTDRYKAVEEFSNGGVSLMVDGIFSPTSEEGTDIGAVLEDYISIGVVRNIS